MKDAVIVAMRKRPCRLDSETGHLRHSDGAWFLQCQINDTCRAELQGQINVILEMHGVGCKQGNSSVGVHVQTTQLSKKERHRHYCITALLHHRLRLGRPHPHIPDTYNINFIDCRRV